MKQWVINEECFNGEIHWSHWSILTSLKMGPQTSCALWCSKKWAASFMNNFLKKQQKKTHKTELESNLNFSFNLQFTGNRENRKTCSVTLWGRVSKIQNIRHFRKKMIQCYCSWKKDKSEERMGRAIQIKLTTKCNVWILLRSRREQPGVNEPLWEYQGNLNIFSYFLMELINTY